MLWRVTTDEANDKTQMNSGLSTLPREMEQWRVNRNIEPHADFLKEKGGIGRSVSPAGNPSKLSYSFFLSMAKECRPEKGTGGAYGETIAQIKRHQETLKSCITDNVLLYCWS